MPRIVKIIESPRKNKIYRVYLENDDYYDFGLYGGDTYIDHHDETKRENYRKKDITHKKSI